MLDDMKGGKSSLLVKFRGVIFSREGCDWGAEVGCLIC